ncbi:MAG: GNAT family N-acetyltransferase [Chitinophagaceae bacterium]|nr:GNAT family N-acetyltransferase [Chitinophagaceae bacterium]
MSLYTFSHSAKLSSVHIPAGLRIEASTDIRLLSIIGNSTIEDVTKRLANDNTAFIAYLNNLPAAFGWMARDNAKIGELNHEFILPEGNRYLWNFRTLEAYRGKGIYPALLQFILQHGDHGSTRFWIIHAPENKASLKGIQNAGFEYVGKLYIDGNNIATIESNETALTFQEELEYMDIKLSGQIANSCWNCSSPYLKKRFSACCCSTAGNECIGNNMLTMAS